MAPEELSTDLPVEEPGQKNFVTLNSLKNYATATASLTLVINIMLYVYTAIRNGKIMPPALVIPLAIVLSIFYILSFFKRDKGLTSAQYIWITALNALMLFTSISGVNGMLDSARVAFSKTNSVPAADTIRTASIGSFFKHIFLPTHGWFNVTEMNDQERAGIIQSTLTTIDTTNGVINDLIRQKEKDITTIDTLTRQLDSVRNQYINTLSQFTQVESTVGSLRSFVNQHPEHGTLSTQLTQLQTTINLKKSELANQRGEQTEQREQNVKIKERNDLQVSVLQEKQKDLLEQKQILKRETIRVY